MDNHFSPIHQGASSMLFIILLLFNNVIHKSLGSGGGPWLSCKVSSIIFFDKEKQGRKREATRDRRHGLYILSMAIAKIQHRNAGDQPLDVGVRPRRLIVKDKF